jgi:uncharacterized protein YegL
MGYNTDITIILDRSGSMQTIREDTIGGVNSFIDSQKEDESSDLVTLVQFDHEYETLYEAAELDQVANLTAETFVPRGSTSLLDALGRTINTTQERLGNLEDDEKPEKVIFVIVTDGQENTSKEFSKKQVFNLISERTEKDGWEFIYVGANQDAIATGRDIGVAAGSSICYAANSVGVTNTYDNISRSVSTRKRSKGWTKLSNFTQKERDGSMGK